MNTKEKIHNLRVDLRISEKLKDQATEKAKKIGMGLSEYIRALIFKNIKK